jgi:hydrogenase expression/formation protein HypC
MCLAIPGKILNIAPDDSGAPMAKVSFGGIAKEVNLSFLPDARVGDYVIVHVGFALSILDEEEAQKVLDVYKEVDAVLTAERSARPLAGQS